ncbi:uncharacterized protein LOC111715278, partial [Eurytemora carolleeae]|uniref:uncharacterized protein LOC111715278 n=1 Tax=Eurytemora carolleeae TaxID=1294199 RepID=UPI000C766DFD
MKCIMLAWIIILSETASAQNCVEEDKTSKDCVPEEEKLDPVGQKITNILSPENEENIIKKGKEEEKRNKGFRSTTPAEDNVALSIWNKLRVLPCKQNCGTFSPTWKKSFDTAVKLFDQLETTDHVKTDFKTFVKIGEEVLELLYEKKEVNENLVKSAYLKAMKLRNDTDGINVDPGQIFPALADETRQNTITGNDYADKPVGETSWKELKKLPSRVAAPEDKLDYFREDTRLHIFHDTFHSLNFGNNEQDRDKMNFSFICIDYFCS